MFRKLYDAVNIKLPCKSRPNSDRLRDVKSNTM